MAGEIEQIFVEFVVDDKALAATVDKLAEAGTIDKTLAATFKQTNTELNNRGTILKEVAGQMSVVGGENKKVKASFDDVNKSVDNFTNNFIEGFEEGVLLELKKAGVSTKEFNEGLKNLGKEGVKSSASLRQQIRALTEQMASLKAQGKDNTEQYKLLTKEAGHLKDAMNDVNQEIRTAGSDTRVFDGLISAATGVVGAMSVAQGAMALFGDENEDLQKTMVKVQGALALLNGLQAIQNVLQKESAAAILANNIAMKAEVATQKIFAFVVGESSGALKVFRIALATTGVGLLVIALTALIAKFIEGSDATEEFNNKLANLNTETERAIANIRDQAEINQATLDKLGAKGSEKVRQRMVDLAKENVALIEAIRGVGDEITELQKKAEFIKLKVGFVPEELKENIDKAIAEQHKFADTIKDNDQQLKVLRINSEKQVTDETEAENKKRIADAKAAAKEREAAEKERLARLKEQRLAEFQDFKANLEIQLLEVEKGSDKELDLRKRIALATLQIELENDKLTQNQRKLAIQKFFQERLDLEKTLAAEQRKLQLENIASDLQASLQAIEISNDERLELTISSIQVQAALEIEAAQGNAAKIQEIAAKRDRAVKDARLQSIQSALTEELALYDIQNDAIIRGLQRVSANQNAPITQRIEAIKEVARIQIESIDLQLAALNKEREQKLISDRDYLREYAKLQDDKLKITENTEQGVTTVVIDENNKRKQSDVERVQQAIEIASQALAVYQSFAQNTNEKENNAINEQKERLKELKENGAITEKQYIQRLKKVEAEEKRVRRDQAEREKRIAVFNAFIGIPQAILKGLQQGGPILAAIYGALATAQLVAVASRPIPKFAKGTHYSPKGKAIVAEDRPEIVESAGIRTLYKSKSVVDLKKGDKVYNAFETQKLLQQNVPNVSKDIIHAPMEINNGVAIDYSKMAKAFKSAIPDKEYGLNIDEHGFQKWTREGLSTTIYHNKRYGKK
jgi:hypothetical protein